MLDGTKLQWPIQLWLQAVSDISGATQVIRRHTVGAALGSSFLAGVAAFAREDIDRINPIEREVRPDPRHARRYGADHALYRMLYQRTRNLMATLTSLTSGAEEKAARISDW